MHKRVLLTGAGGFIGSHVLRHLLTETDWDVVATDSFRHKGKTDRIYQQLRGITNISAPDGYTLDRFGDRIMVITHDLSAPFSPQMGERIGAVDYVIAMASQSHVDRSIEDPAGFIRNNVDVALNTLEFARYALPDHVILISTDEVYGPVDRGSAGHPEWAPIIPSNPYSASKAAQEAIATSYWRTYGLPLTIVNCMNLIGEMQDPEKYLPSLIANISNDRWVTVHGTADNIGTRHYLHARNLADALVHIFRELPATAWAFPFAGRPQRFNVAGPDCVSNLELAQMVSQICEQRLKYRLEDFHSTRPGHDPHYGLDPAKLTAAGWKPPVPFAASLERTVRWTLAHPEWMR